MIHHRPIVLRTLNKGARCRANANYRKSLLAKNVNVFLPSRRKKNNINKLVHWFHWHLMMYSVMAIIWHIGTMTWRCSYAVLCTQSTMAYNELASAEATKASNSFFGVRERQWISMQKWTHPDTRWAGTNKHITHTKRRETRIHTIKHSSRS